MTERAYNKIEKNLEALLNSGRLFEFDGPIGSHTDRFSEQLGDIRANLSDSAKISSKHSAILDESKSVGRDSSERGVESTLFRFLLKKTAQFSLEILLTLFRKYCSLLLIIHLPTGYIII